MNSADSIIHEIDDHLPQTQCGLCTYSGCRPYAEAIALNQESIDKCLPGGVATLKKLAKITEIDATPLIKGMQEKAKPASYAKIREAECIGCTKCIQACPVDAIIGSSKLMHTVLTDECTGCELCIAPCPVDCIDMFIIDRDDEESQKMVKAHKARKRFNAHNQRLQMTTTEQIIKPPEQEMLDTFARLKAKKAKT